MKSCRTKDSLKPNFTLTKTCPHFRNTPDSKNGSSIDRLTNQKRLERQSSARRSSLDSYPCTHNATHPALSRPQQTPPRRSLPTPTPSRSKSTSPSTYLPWPSLIREEADRQSPRSGHLDPHPRTRQIANPVPSLSSQSPGPHLSAPSPRYPTRHVVFIGETGSGKSSIINLITGRDHATVSPDANPCTTGFASYDVAIQGRTYRLWDTPGLNEATSVGWRPFSRSSATHASLKQFLRERRRSKELDLVVFCVRGSRAHKGMARAYKIFCHGSRQVAIPVVVAVTHLEKEQPMMDAWWQHNERTLSNLGLFFDGHACLTCMSRHHRRQSSREEILVLISADYRQRAGAESVSSEHEYLPDDRCVVC